MKSLSLQQPAFLTQLPALTQLEIYDFSDNNFTIPKHLAWLKILSSNLAKILKQLFPTMETIDEELIISPIFLHNLRKRREEGREIISSLLFFGSIIALCLGITIYIYTKSFLFAFMPPLIVLGGLIFLTATMAIFSLIKEINHPYQFIKKNNFKSKLIKQKNLAYLIEIFQNDIEAYADYDLSKLYKASHARYYKDGMKNCIFFFPREKLSSLPHLSQIPKTDLPYQSFAPKPVYLSW